LLWDRFGTTHYARWSTICASVNVVARESCRLPAPTRKNAGGCAGDQQRVQREGVDVDVFAAHFRDLVHAEATPPGS
jgi:hypothetical protein